MKKGLLVTFLLFLGIFSTNSLHSAKNIDSLLKLGKDYYKQFDTSQTEFVFKLINLKKSQEYLKQALEIDSLNPEANYFLAYAINSEMNGSSPVDSIPNFTIETARKVSKYLINSVKNSTIYNGEKLYLSPYSKITSVYGCAALAYLKKGDIDSAKIAFNEAKENYGYNDVLLEYSRNLLNNCDTNAILITWGDMDTFPLYYLQFVKNFRKDVLVCNIGLLSTKWFAKMITLDSIFNKVNINLNEKSLDSLEALTPMFIQLKNYSIDVPFEIIKKYNVKDEFVKGQGIFNWVVFGSKYNDENYLNFSDLLLLEIFKSNKWNRRITFSTTINTNLFYSFGWIKNVIQKGLVYELTPDSFKEIDQVDYLYLKKMIFDNKSGWTFDEVQNSIVNIDYDSKMFLSNYQQTFLLLAYYYTEIIKDPLKTKEVLDRFELKLPMNIIPLDKRDINYWADIYRFAGEIEKANFIQGLIYEK